MLGIQLWIWLAALSSLVVVIFCLLRFRQRTWTHRILLMLGTLALIWGVGPVLGGHGISPYLVVGAIIAFGFLVLSESMTDSSSW